MMKCLLLVVFTAFLAASVAFLMDFLPDGRDLFEALLDGRGDDETAPWERQPPSLPPEEDTAHPIVLWWTPFTPYERIVKDCSLGSCLFTQSRTEQTNPNTTAFMFYGTFINWNDLPLPRRPSDLWVLLHEESPKNNWKLAHEKGISLFNLTSTCSRHSSYPVTTQFLHSLEELVAPVRVATAEKSESEREAGLGLVMYIQSDCNPPSDRDSYVEELMKHVKVDSYGRCLHNRDLPENLTDTLTFDSADLYDIQARYKFTLAFENALCHDYITEKFWRPLYVGSVPVVLGSPTIKDWAPDREHSIIVAEDFPGPRELAEYLKYLDENDEEYDKFLEFKRTGVKNEMLLRRLEQREWVPSHQSQPVAVEGLNSIEGFECFVCDEIHKRRKSAERGTEPPEIIADRSHYNCLVPQPALAETLPGATIREKVKEGTNEELKYWWHVAACSEREADAVHRAIAGGGGQREVDEALRHACSDLHHL